MLDLKKPVKLNYPGHEWNQRPILITQIFENGNCRIKEENSRTGEHITVNLKNLIPYKGVRYFLHKRCEKT